MKRRNFLQMMAAAGLTAQAPLWAPKAQAAPPDRFLIVFMPGAIAIAGVANNASLINDLRLDIKRSFD